MKTGEAIAEILKREGIEILFGYPVNSIFEYCSKAGIKPIIGCEITMEDGFILPVLVQSRAGYQNLCRLLTRARLRGTKTEYVTGWRELEEFADGLVPLTDGGLREGKGRLKDRAVLAAERLARLQQP